MIQFTFLLGAALACITPAAFAATTPSYAINWIDCTSNIPQPLQGSSLPSPLPSTLKCGQLNVPMDHTKPFSETNNITLGFAMRRPENPKGLINL